MNQASIILIAIFPIIGYFYHKNLPKLGKIRFYIYLIGWYWGLTAFLFAVHKGHDLFTIETWNVSFLLKICLWTGISIWLLCEVLPVILALTSERYRGIVQREVIIKDTMPLTPSERKLFLFVALTVGFCEEVMWRGLLPSLLHDLLLPYWLCFIVAAVTFGLGHFLQGWQGIMNSLILAAVATFIFVLTGNLFVPIILHILYDYRLVLTGIIIKSNNNKSTSSKSL